MEGEQRAKNLPANGKSVLNLTIRLKKTREKKKTNKKTPKQTTNPQLCHLKQLFRKPFPKNMVSLYTKEVHIVPPVPTH